MYYFIKVFRLSKNKIIGMFLFLFFLQGCNHAEVHYSMKDNSDGDKPRRNSIFGGKKSESKSYKEENSLRRQKIDISRIGESIDESTVVDSIGIEKASKKNSSKKNWCIGGLAFLGGIILSVIIIVPSMYLADGGIKFYKDQSATYKSLLDNCSVASNCASNLSFCQNILNTTTSELSNCSSQLGVSSNDLSTCNSALVYTVNNLANCTTELANPSVNLPACTQALDSVNANYNNCTSSLFDCTITAAGTVNNLADEVSTTITKYQGRLLNLCQSISNSSCANQINTSGCS